MDGSYGIHNIILYHTETGLTRTRRKSNQNAENPNIITKRHSTYAVLMVVGVRGYHYSCSISIATTQESPSPITHYELVNDECEREGDGVQWDQDKVETQPSDVSNPTVSFPHFDHSGYMWNNALGRGME
jgi:hypothetical protein